MSRTIPPRVVIALLAISLVLVDLGGDFGFIPHATAQSAAPYHWARTRSHFRLRIGNNVAGDWNSYLRGALDEWNQGDTVTLIEVDGATSPQTCDPVSGTVQVCDWWSGTQTGWLGLTRLYFNHRGDHIDAATVQLNDSFLYAPNSPYNSDAARRHTVCHELGHTLGLDHVATASCMNNSQDAVFHNLTPINDDFRQLRRIYEHEDATRTVARAQDADLNVFGSTWPEPDSEEEVMALPLDEETSVLTFVTWADEAVLAGGASVDALSGDLGLAPATTDSDGDGVADADELALYRTDPAQADTDGDGALDGEELFGRHTDPLRWDDGSTALSSDPGADPGALAPEPAAAASAGPAVATDQDADNYPDTSEMAIGLDPNNPDTDGDGVADGDEGPLYGTDPLAWDSDGDGLSDGQELFATGSDPLTVATTSDGMSDAEPVVP